MGEKTLHDALTLTLSRRERGRRDTPLAASPVSKNRDRHGRGRIPGEIERKEVTHDLSEVEKAALGGVENLIELPAETSEQLDWRPSALFVTIHVRKKYARKEQLPESGLTLAEQNVVLARKPPTVTITQKVGQADPTSSSPINFTAVFSETVNRVTLDLNAAGHGWFVDQTPTLDEEYSVASGTSLKAIDPRAVDRIDLLSVVEHELGHVLGLDDLDALADNLMSSVLETGVRKTPYQRRADAAFAAV